MKTLALLLATCFLAVPFALAQENYGTIKATTKLLLDGSKSTTIMDPDKHTAEETILDARNKVLRKTVYPLNDRNFARGAIHYNAKGVVIYKEVYVYDFNGRITESKLLTKDYQPKGHPVQGE